MATPIGIITPLRLGSQGYFEQSYSTDQSSRINLENLLRTRKGERPMNPTYGSDLYSIIFDPNVEDIQPLAEDVIKNETAFWVPYIIIDGVEVDRSITNLDTYQADIKISFHVNKLSPEIQTIEFSIQQDK